MGLSPNLSAHSGHLKFDWFPKDWVYVGKILAFASLNPTHAALRRQGIYRSNRAAKLKTVVHHLTGLRKLAAWAEKTGRSNYLAGWTASDCTSYLEHARSAEAPSRLEAAEEVLRVLHRYGSLFKDGGLSVAIPRAIRHRNSGDIKTPAIPPETFWPLVRASWTYIDVFSKDLLEARKELDALDDEIKARIHRLSSKDIDASLQSWLKSDAGFVPLLTSSMGRGVAGEINWGGLASRLSPPLDSRIFYQSRGDARKLLVRNAVAGGVSTRTGVTLTRPSIVEGQDGTRGPWCTGFDRANVSRELTNLRTAIYIFVSMMTMMRDSEVQGIPTGSLAMSYGAPVIRSRVQKHKGPGGAPDEWWVSEPVVEAVHLAEKLTRSTERIFGSVREGTKGFDSHEQIHAFISRINAHSPMNGLEKIPDGRISPHMFRRTMAILTANEPDGEIALGITLKHNATRALANSMTSGYGAPTPGWAKEFDHESKNAAAGELIAEWTQHAQGQKIARGPGSKTYLDGLDQVSSKAASMPIPIGDERMLRDLLRDEFSTIHLGTLNHCLGDVAKAECLRNLSEKAKAAGPVPSLCSPSTCANSVITDQHMPVWLREEQELQSRLADKRMADVHRRRLVVQLEDVRRLIRQEPK